MAERALEQRVENLERQATAVAQILPTLATKADLAELKAATKVDLAELKAATKVDLAELRAATKADLAELRAEARSDLNELKIELKAEWKADIVAAIAPLATKAELHAAIAPLATKAEVKAEAEETRRHFDVVAEGLRSNIVQLADAIGTVSSTLERSIAENRNQHATFIAALDNHEVRLTALERPSDRA